MGIRERLWPGLRTRGITLEAGLALLSTVGVGIGTRIPEGRLIPVPVLYVGSVLLGIALLLFRRRAPLVPFLLNTALSLVSPAGSIAVPLTSYAVGRYIGRWPILIAAAVVGSVALVEPWKLNTLDDWLGAVAGVAVTVLLAGALGAWARTRAALVDALTERAERAEGERELMARDAVLTERTRIAREMHDVVGHRVSLMVLQSGAIEMAAADRGRVEQLARQVQTAGRQALEELRQMVGVLRAEELDDATPLGPQPGLGDLTHLVAQAGEAGMAVELRGLPDGSAPVDPTVGRAAFRIVQEALTNAAKHAPGAPVCVTVERPDGELVVRVVSGPSDRSSGESSGGGYGLVGLAERVRTLNGRLSAEPRLDGGFAVEAVLPA
jgi:signal transduction histidine kinase